MTCGERVKLIRKEKGLTLEKFGEPIGVGKTAISMIENNVNNLTDQMLMSICRVYDINEEWLRNGTGEMFISVTRDEQIADFIGDILRDEDDSFRKRMVSVLAKLSEEEWKVLEGIAERITESKGQ